MRPVNKGESPYVTINDYKEALPHLEERIGSYCSYCGFPLVHVPEVEHVVSKSKEPTLATKWVNLLLGCKYCNTRKSNVVSQSNFDEYLWPDIYNTAVAFSYNYGIPKINKTVLQEIDPSGVANRKAEKIFELIKLEIQDSPKPDRRVLKRNEAYNEAKLALERWRRNRNEDMRDQIVASAISYGFFSVWTSVFADEPEMLNALIDAFPGTAKEFFGEDGLPRTVLKRDQELCTV